MGEITENVLRLSQAGVVAILLFMLAMLGIAIRTMFKTLMELTERAFTTIECSSKIIEAHSKAVEANARASESNKSAIDSLREYLLHLRRD